MANKYVIVHPKMGIFLGTYAGLAFWSRLESAGQIAAPAFDSINAALEYMATWECGPPRGAYCHRVEADVDGGTYASMAACIHAGLEGWLDSSTEVVNKLPA